MNDMDIKKNMNCLFINNPNSGKGKISKKLNYIKAKLEETFKSVDIKTPSNHDETLILASHACDNYDVLVFAGGDGTFNNIVNAIANKNKRPILGYIPAGTVNDISKNFKISKNIKKAIKTIQKGYVQSFDIGKVTYLDNDNIDVNYFVYVMAMGSFAHVSYDTNQDVKRKFGRVAYYLRVVKEVLKKHLFTVKISFNDDSKIEMETPLVLILNSCSVGGFKVNKKSKMNDGLFDVYVMKPGFASGLFNVIRKRKHILKKASSMIVHLDSEWSWCVDGEKGYSKTIQVENLNNHLKIFSKIKCD